MKIIADAIGFFAAHAVPTASLVSAGIALVAAKAPAWLSKEVEKEVADCLVEVKNPKAKAVAVAVLDWIDSIVPDGGDARFAIAADFIIREEPLLAPLRAQLIAMFVGFDKSLKEGIEAAEKDAQDGTAPKA